MVSRAIRLIGGARSSSGRPAPVYRATRGLRVRAGRRLGRTGPARLGPLRLAMRSSIALRRMLRISPRRGWRLASSGESGAMPCPCARPREHAVRVGFGEAHDLVVVVVLELGGALDQRLALRHDLALVHAALLGDVAIDAVRRVVDPCRSGGRRLERGTLAIVARARSSVAAPAGPLQAVRRLPAWPSTAYRRRFQAIEGIGRREERLLLAGDEVIDHPLDAIASSWRVARAAEEP